MTTEVPARQRLLDAAIEAFAQNGYHATTTRDIASRAGMSPAAVYVHHASKESLLYAVSLAGHLETLALVEQAAARSDNPVQRLRDLVYDFTVWHAKSSPRARIVQYEYRALTPDHRREIADHRRAIEAVMDDVLRSGQATGDFHVDRLHETGRAILSLAIDVVRWYEPGRPIQPPAIAELYVELALKMVGATAP